MLDFYRALPPEGAKILLVLALSFLTGLEREEHHAGSEHYSFGGVRTFPLIGLIGYAMAFLSGGQFLAVAVGFAVVAGFLMLAYQHKVTVSGLAGFTSEMSALTTYLAGALVYRDQFWIATTISVASMLLLELKAVLEGLTKRFAPGEIFTFTKFLLLSAVILPVLPNREFGPFVSEFNIRYRSTSLGRFTLRIPGHHNVLNAMAAIAVAMELDVKPDAIREGLATFSGVDRRFQMRGKERGITVVDDYGHHPTEIRATLDGARLCGFRRIHVLFQPHRYSRTFHLMDEFARSFLQADSVFVMDIYAASEQPIEGVTAEALADRIRQFGHRGVEYVGSIDRGVDALVGAAADGDLVLTLGAGNVWQAGEKVLERLRVGGPD